MTEVQRVQLTRLRNEIAFLRGDESIGGGDHDRAVEELRAQIRAICEPPQPEKGPQ